MTNTPSANAAIAALRKAGITDRLAGKVGGEVRVFLQYAAERDAAVATLAARFPAAAVVAEGDMTLVIRPASNA